MQRADAGTTLPTAKVLADEPSGRSGSATIRHCTTLRAVQLVFINSTLPGGTPIGQAIWKFLAERHHPDPFTPGASRIAPPMADDIPYGGRGGLVVPHERAPHVNPRDDDPGQSQAQNEVPTWVRRSVPGPRRMHREPPDGVAAERARDLMDEPLPARSTKRRGSSSLADAHQGCLAIGRESDARRA